MTDADGSADLGHTLQRAASIARPESEQPRHLSVPSAADRGVLRLEGEVDELRASVDRLHRAVIAAEEGRP